MTGTYSEEILNNLKKHDFNVEFSVLKHDYTIPVFYTKVKLIDKLAPEEQQALLKMIDLAISNKRMKDNLSNLMQ